VLLLADDLLHRTNLLYSVITKCIIHNWVENARKIFGEPKLFCQRWGLGLEETGKQWSPNCTDFPKTEKSAGDGFVAVGEYHWAA
ncbi:MAG: hypothetical protein IKU31_04880, partial [Oscillospiraceae bacterium]|nr:hypothetical protein [Oscillospiraceae bacterium]